MADNLQLIRDYAASLQGDERKAFIDKFNSIKDDDNKVSILAQKLGSLNSTEETNVPQQNNTVKDVAIGAGAVAGAGAAVYGLGRYINAPNRMIKPIEKQLEGIARTQIGKQVATSDLPELLTAKYRQFQADTIKPSMDAINQNHKIQSAEIRNNRNLFDQRVVNPAVDATAKHIADNYKVFTNSGYQSYRNAQNAIESIIEQTGQSLRSEDIANNLFGKTLNDSIQRGVPEHLLSKLKKLASSFETEGSIVDLLGNKMNTSEPIPFSQIKGNVAYLLKELPDGARHALADNWSAYMGQYVPEQARGIFDNMQQQYAKFAPARNALFDLIDRQSGSFDTKKLSNRLRNFIKTNQDAGLTDLLGVLKQGTDITEPIPGLAEKIDGISDLGNQRNSYAAQLINLEKTKESAMKGAKQVDDLLNAGRQEYTKVHLETKKLLSERNAILEKYPIRNALRHPSTIVKGIGKLAQLGGKLAVGLPFGVVSGELDKRAGGFDPAEGFKAWYTGTFGSEKDKKNMSEEYARRIQQQMGI